MKRYAAIAVLCAVSLLTLSCSKESFLGSDGVYRTVFIYLGLGYNNLSSYLENNLEDMCEGVLNGKNNDAAIVAFCHNTASSSNYSTANPPVLLQIYRELDRTVVDTLKVYPESTVSASAETLNQVLTEIMELFPSKSYGMLFSSHATGWIPVGYSAYGENRSVSSAVEESQYPLTKTVGAQYSRENGSTVSTEIDICDFADAIPMHLDYLIFDACLMGTVEIAYQLRNVCDYIVFSPAEVIATGFVYKTLPLNLLCQPGPDLLAVANEYYERYEAMSGSYRSATVTVLDCSGLEELKVSVAGLVEALRDGIDSIERDEVQKYFYSDSRLFFFYDLRDIFREAGATDAQLEQLDSALDACIPYHAETEYFFNLELERCCGLAMYIPDETLPTLNSYYSGLDWNLAVSLIR